MASDVEICNRALQKLGAKRILSLTDVGVPNAARCNASYELIRDQELRKRPWGFAIKRVQLPADVAVPVFGYSNAFTLPTDCLRILPANTVTDWSVENGKILTNDGAPLDLRYIARIVDPNLFDVNFSEALAAKIAYELCEEITQSNAKQDRALNDYDNAIRDAWQLNAFEKVSEELPEDPWVAARL